MRLVVISKGVFVQISNWLETGWQLLRQALDRDCLLPSPTDGFRGCRRKELKYTMGSAVQFRLLSSLNVNGKQFFSHSRRNFLPSSAAALVYPKTDRDLLGGWSAKASDRYTRLARQRITAMQLAVAKTFTDRWNLDPLAESETLDCFQAFMSEVGVPEESVAVTMGLLTSRQFTVVPREQSAALQSLEPVSADELVMEDPFLQEPPDVRSDKRRKSENTRVRQLGERSEEGPLRGDSFPSAWLLCVCLQEERHAYSTTARRATEYLALTTLAFGMLEMRCLQAISSTMSAACARKRVQLTMLKEIRARLKPHLRRMKIEG